HRSVYEAGIHEGAALLVVYDEELSGERHLHHLDPGDLIQRHHEQRVIERFGSNKERALQHGAVDLALEDACLDQAKKRLEQHFADAVETFFEGSALQSRGWLGCGRKPLHDRMKSRIVVVTDDQTL